MMPPEDDEEALLAIARACAEVGQDLRALELLAKALHRNGRSAAAWLQIGLVLTRTGDTELALDALDHATRLAPEDGDAHFHRGLLLAALNREAEAQHAFSRSVELSPAFAKIGRRGPSP
jgi:tetratricopeptide (TPR) repeat protein